MPDQDRSAEKLSGYFRLNRERTLRAAARKGLTAPRQIADALAGAAGQATFFRAWQDQRICSARFLYAMTTLLDVSVEEIFDAVSTPPGSRLTETHERSKTDAPSTDHDDREPDGGSGAEVHAVG